MPVNKKQYPLTIEILEDHPSESLLEKGDVCHAYGAGDLFIVYDNKIERCGGWYIKTHQAKIIE